MLLGFLPAEVDGEQWWSVAEMDEVAVMAGRLEGVEVGRFGSKEAAEVFAREFFTACQGKPPRYEHASGLGRPARIEYRAPRAN